MNKISRREFLASSGKAAVGVGLGAVLNTSFTKSASAKSSIMGSNDKVLIGCIGCGGINQHNMFQYLWRKDTEIVALCDVDRDRLAKTSSEVRKHTGKTPKTFTDYRQMLDMKDLDAVLICTPDHWHALQAIHACEAGKDIYLEKPISHDIVEGKCVVGAAKRFKRVIQVGTWQRSVQHYYEAMKYFQTGVLGKVNIVRAWTCGGSGVGKAAPSNPPPTLDWDFYVGPAQYEPYRSNIHPGLFRWYFNYAAGLTGDWGVHMLDTVGTFMNEWHPLQVSSVGGRFYMAPDDDRTTPDTHIAIFQFPNWVLQWEVHVGGPGLDGGDVHGVEFICEKGILRIDRFGYKFMDRDYKELPGPKDPEKISSNHWENFIDCIKSREKPRSDIETMHYSSTLCHLANMTYLLGRSIKWDGKNGEVIGDNAAMQNQSYYREYRKPWVLPRYDKKSV